MPDGNEVGVEEVQRQVEKAGNSKMIKRVAKAVMRMSVAMGLEPIGAQGKSNVKSPKSNLRGISGCLLCDSLLLHYFDSFCVDLEEASRIAKGGLLGTSSTGRSLWL